MNKPPVKKVKELQDWLYIDLTPEGGLDPYHFSHYLEEWAALEEIDLGDEPEVYKLTPEQLEGFKDWLIETEKGIEFARQMPYESPAYLTLQYAKKLPSGTWCIHFTPSDPFEAFDRGTTIDGLHLSSWTEKKTFVDCKKQLSDNIGSGEVVYGFAFLADKVNVLEQSHSYGDNAVLFQTDGGVLAYHVGDEENQVIFPLCSEYNAIPLYNPKPGEIVVYEGGKELRYERLQDLIRNM